MGKIRKIKTRFESLEQNVNLVSEKLVEFDSFKEDMTTLHEKFNHVYELFTTEEEELSEEEQKKLMEEQLEQMKAMVQGAIIDLVNKPENQKALQEFVSQFRGAMSGDPMSMGFDMDSIMDKDGYVDPLKAALVWFTNRTKGSGEAPKFSGTKGKTGYG